MESKFCVSLKYALESLFRSSLFMDLAGPREGHGHTPRRISGQHGYITNRGSRMFGLQPLDIIPL